MIDIYLAWTMCQALCQGIYVNGLIESSEVLLLTYFKDEEIRVSGGHVHGHTAEKWRKVMEHGSGWVCLSDREPEVWASALSCLLFAPLHSPPGQASQ